MNAENQSRTEHSARNITYATIGRAISLIMGYVSRIVFTHTLSSDYVGVNGVFFDILNVLSLTELGFGTAISYALYKPIADNDTEKQKSYMALYRKFYYVVATIVAVLGILVVPFLDVIIKDKPNVEHLTLIYLLYLASSVCSYFMIYKRTLLDAHQLSHIGTLYQNLAWIVQIVFQIIILITTHNFVLYVLLAIAGTLAGNIMISLKADKLYPFINDKNITPLEKEEKHSIFANVKAMLLHKLGDVAINNTDNLLLSALVGIMAAGKYSNYFLVTEAVRSVFEQVFTGITGSIGNLTATENSSRIKRIYDSVFFMGHWMYGFAAVCLYEAIDLFVSVSFGEIYVFEKSITLMLIVNFYVTGMRNSTLTFRNTLGLFYYDRYKSIVAAIINLVSSIILGKMYGTIGIFAGTFISTMLTSFWIEPYVLYKRCFKMKVWEYFGKYIVYAASTMILLLAADFLCKLVVLSTFATIIVRFIICVVVVNFGYFAMYFWTKEFKLLTQKGLTVMKKKFSKKKGN